MVCSSKGWQNAVNEMHLVFKQDEFSDKHKPYCERNSYVV